MGGGYVVCGHVHRPPEANVRTVGGPETTPGGLHVVNRL